MIHQSSLELVGGTPLLQLNNWMRLHGLKANVIAKIEALNPAGSVKDRAARQMILEAEKTGLIGPGAVIIEPTSGNTGIGLASIAAARGYRAIFTMPETMSVERFIPQQFENPANPLAHYLTTGPEIWADTDGHVDMFVAGVGTSGTVTGNGRYLKKKNPAVKVVAVEPDASPVLSGGKAGPHAIQGIGANFVPGNYDASVVDEVFRVPNDAAIAAARALPKAEGILIGISGGAALHAATELAKRPENEGRNIVVIFPDNGERYLSTVLYAE